MQILIYQDKHKMGSAMAERGAALIQQAIAQDGHAFIILATGASQFELLAALITKSDIDWSKVTAFHLDEYVGLPATHKASFRQYLQTRFVQHIPNLCQFVDVKGDAADLPGEIARLNAEIEGKKIAVCFAGIGENAHLAFNDPPANFETRAPYHIVDLDDACRRQQLGEGWFPTLEDVPRQAISMSIRQMLAAECLVLTVPDLRKAEAVQQAIEGPLTPHCPASILRLHPHCVLALDEPSASLLQTRP